MSDYVWYLVAAVYALVAFLRTACLACDWGLPIERAVSRALLWPLSLAVGVVREAVNILRGG
jgi:hypothetical protein